MTNQRIIGLVVLLAVAAGAAFLIFKPHASFVENLPNPNPTPIPAAVPISSSFGYVSGHVTIGPNCPGPEVEGKPCTTPPEAYSSRNVIFYESDGVTVKDFLGLDAKGNYKISLAPGSYFVQIQPAGIGAGEKKAVTVKSGMTTIADFDIDTGIR